MCGCSAQYTRGCARARCHPRCDNGLPYGCEEIGSEDNIGCTCHTDLCNGAGEWSTASLAPSSLAKAMNAGAALFRALNIKIHMIQNGSYMIPDHSVAFLKASDDDASGSSAAPVRPVMIVDMVVLLIVFIAAQLL